ncbi:MAG: lytic murein transglycosylase [Pseudomonadota bacterium]|nr:lytic murein transglycosylase [Pseudomonadota bacterium]
MNKILKLTFIAVAAVLTVLPSLTKTVQAADKAENTPPKEWTMWLESLQREMISKGISQETLDKAYKGKNYYHPLPEVVQLDKKQTEFVLTTCAYVNRLVSAKRVEDARIQYKKLNKKYKKLEDSYNIPLSYLTAFWAVETNFGQNTGKYHLIHSLTNLSYKNRRSKFFKNELYHVLKIMDKNNLGEDKMLGSWAGAMGHFQFMPSTYNSYAVDYDGDGVPDIWNSFDDSIASAANYLKELGWKKNEPWGMRISLPWNFDFKTVGRQTTKKVSEWKKLGVKTYYGYNLPYDNDLKGSVILPDGRKGPAFIVFGNFKRIMIWNRSDNYALAIVTLADYIRTPKKKWGPLCANEQYVMNSDEIKTIQKFYNRFVRNKIKEDGKLGSETRKAVKFLQHKAKLPEDGYPDYRLLSKIKNYNPKMGFAVPVPEAKKVHKAAKTKIKSQVKNTKSGQPKK